MKHPLADLFIMYCVFGAGAVAIFAAGAADGDFGFAPEGIGKEGRMVLGGLMGLLWPLLIVAGLLWCLAFVARGFVQIVRTMLPKRTKVPEARTVRR